MSGLGIPQRPPGDPFLSSNLESVSQGVRTAGGPGLAGPTALAGLLRCPFLMPVCDCWTVDADRRLSLGDDQSFEAQSTRF